MIYLKSFVISVGIVAGLLALAAPASATTFCVPAFFDGCPNAGGNQARASLTAAMSDNGNDGQPDRVLVAPGSFHEPGNQQLEASGLDPLEVIGAGKDQTRVTADVSGNVFMARLNDREGIRISDLTLVGPPTLGQGNSGGAIAQLKNVVLTDVDVEVRNEGADGFTLIGNNVITRTRMKAEEGKSIDFGIRLNGSSPGSTVVIGSEISDARYGFSAVAPNVKLDVLLTRVVEPQAAAAWVGKGGELGFQNSVVESAGNHAFIVESETGTAKDTLLEIDSSTLYNRGTPVDPALYVFVPGTLNTGDANVTVDSSIIHGFDSSWKITVPAGPGLPRVSMVFDHSNFPPVGEGGSPEIDSPSNINADPLFVTPQDLGLLPDSPSIDAGDPASILTYDFLGEPRPRDGDLNGSSLPDQGAFEFQPTCQTVPAVCPKDTVAPKLSKVNFRFRKGRGGALGFRLSESSVVRARFTPVPKKGRKTVKLARSFKAGARRFKLGKRQLKRGRYRVRITATDSAGNVSKAVTRKVKVRR